MTVIRSPISPVIFSPLRAPTALYKGGGASLFSKPGLPLWNAAGEAMLAGTRNAKLALIGDSTTLGAGSNGALLTNCRVNSYPTQLAALLASAGLPVGLDSFWGRMGAASTAALLGIDPRLGGNAVANATFVIGGFAYQLESTATLTFEPDGEVDTFDIYYAANTGLGVLSASIDGGAATTVNTNATAATAKLTVTAALGTHTLTLSASSGVVVPQGVDAYNSAIKRVSVWNMGASGSRIGEWTTGATAYHSRGQLAALAPDLTIICLTINSWKAAISDNVATFKSNTQLMIDAAALSGDVILMSGAPSADIQATAAQMAPYITAYDELAATNDIQHINLTEVFGSYAAANSAGLMYDTLHPDADGYAEKAAAVRSRIIA